MLAPGVSAADPATWLLGDGSLQLSRPIVLGVLNLTPDSFSDGGLYADAGAAVARAERMVELGADLVDVGGESTRPGAEPVPPDEEWARIGAVVRDLALRGIRVSVDTRKASVARRALDAGAAAINDVSGLRDDPEVARAAAHARAGLILMHMRGTPRTMQADVTYGDLLGEVEDFLRDSMASACELGCEPGQLVIDPGIGFGKSATGSLALIAATERFVRLGRPVLIGPSRKSFIGEVLGVPVERRLEGTIAACLAALERGARLFRVHDVGEVRRALDMSWAIRSAQA